MNTTRLFRMAPTALVMLLLAGPLFFSCSNEFDPWGTEGDAELMTISVDQAGTRTTNNGNSTLWSEGDALSVIHAKAGGDTFWSSRFGYSGDNSFQGSVSRLSSSNDWYAVYPYVEENNAANEIHLTFPASQVQTGNNNKSHFSGEQFPMFGKKTGVSRSDELSLSMKNVLSAAEFNVTNKEDYPIVVKEIELTSSSYIAGGFKVDLTSNEPVFTAESGSKTVKLAVTDGQEIAADGNALFYMAIAPFDIPAGGSFEIKVVAENPSGTNVVFYHTYELTNGTSFVSGLIKPVNVNFDDDSSQNPDPGTAGEVELEVGEQPEDGVYLLVYKHGETSMAFAAFDEYKSQKYAIPVTVVDNQVLPQEDIDLSRFAITIEKAGIEHPNDAGHDAYNVKNSEDKFIFYASGGSGDAILRIQDTNTLTNSSTGNTVAYYHTFVQAADGVQILSSGSESGYNKYLLAYTAANGFYYEQENNGQKLHLYLLGGTAKEHQELAFSAERVEYDFDAMGPGVLANAPTLTGAMTTVTYSSSDESVASVDADGNVTIHKAGTATITATAAADDVYYSATAQYLIVATTSAGTTFYRVTEFTAGEQYLIVSAGKALTNNDGSIDATDVSASGDEVIVSDAASMMWTATASGSGFTLSNNGYYVQRASSQGGGKPSISNNPSTSYYVWNYSNNKLSTSGSYSTYYLYYSSGWAQTSSSSSAGTVTIYSSTKPLTPQSLSFANSTVKKVLGEDCQIGDTFNVQEVRGAMTTVTYTSSKPSVATINGKVITVVGKGSTTITATAAEENGFKSATASYTLRITEPVTGDIINLNDSYNDGEPFNLENDALREYLDAAAEKYNEDNITSESIIKTYYNKYSSNRLDIPKPVTIEWDSPSVGETTITVFRDQEMNDEVWNWTTTSGSTSYDVYNLIPGETYYCTVEDSSGFLLKGMFQTTGRRRMMKVSDTANQNNAGNCRDLGGLKTTDGKRIKYGYIYRGTNLDSTSPEEQAYMLNYMNIGLDNELREGTRTNRLGVRFVNPGYSGTGDLQNKSKFKQTMQAFIDVAIIDHKASYFHCQIGSDRTGYTGFMLEAMLGVSANDCSIDYEITTFAGPIIGSTSSPGSRLRNDTGFNYFRDARNYISGLGYSSVLSLQGKVIKYVNEELGISMDDINAYLEEVLEDDPDQ